MRSYEFITEAEVKPYEYKGYKNPEEVLNLLRTECSESFSLIENPIWRGMTNHTAPIVQIDPSTGIRQSQNTSNFYTNFMDHSPYMQGWPKRSRSLVCSSRKGIAYRYANMGGLYAIFPKNGVNIAVCPDYDMWRTRFNLPIFPVYSDLGEFSNLMDDLGFDDDSWSGIVRYANSPTFQKNIDRILLPEYVGKVSGAKFIDMIQLALSPKKAKFKLMDIKTYAASNVANNEVWIGGPVVALSKYVYTQFLSYANRGNI
jgi:hypothetical protein